MAGTNDLTVAQRIRARFEELTRAERQLASSLLSNYPVSGLGSITIVADAADVSTPTVVRMARKLGYAGFPDMQAALRTELEATISNPIAKHDRWSGAAPDTHMLNRFADAAMQNMRLTTSQIDPASFDAVAELLADPTRAVHVVGGRITRAIADYFFTHMQVIRSNVTLLASNSNTWPHFLLNMQPGDVLILFDIRRYENDILRLAEMAKERGVVLVLFTDHWGSPVTLLADHAFAAHIEAPSAWDSTLVITFIVEALIAAIQNITWETSRERMSDLEKLFDRTRQFRKFK